MHRFGTIGADFRTENLKKLLFEQNQPNRCPFLDTGAPPALGGGANRSAVPVLLRDNYLGDFDALKLVEISPNLFLPHFSSFF